MSDGEQARRVPGTTENLAALLVDHPFPDDRPLLLTIDEVVTAGEARGRARRTADALREHGVGPGHAVAVHRRDGPDVVTAMAGVWLAGAVLVPVNARAPVAEVDRILDATAPAAVIDASGITPRPDGRVHDPGTALVLWTSGTTGPPQPVLHTHRGYLELIDRVLRSIAGTRATGREPMPNLVPVSLALNAGIYNTLFGLRSGAAVVLMDGFDPRTFATLVRRFGIRSTVLPPAAMTALADDDAVTALAPLRIVRSITAPLSPVQARRFAERFGVVVLNGYGQTEIGEVIGWTAADAREHPDKLGAVGRPHPGVVLRIVDDDGQPVASGAVGRLLVRPRDRSDAGLAAGLEARLDADGYLDTGDLARVDADGFVWLEGRASDVINRGGNKVFPDHVEEVLRLAPGVVDAAVVGVADDRLGEVPVAFVVGDAPDDAALDALCREHLVAYKVPVAFHRVEALPRSEIGKVLRRELVARHTAKA